MPSSIVACHVSQPVPAAPMRLPAGTRTPSNVTAYCVSAAIVWCWSSVMPSLVRVDGEQVDAGVAAREHDEPSAACAYGTCHFTPSSTNPSPSAFAVERDPRRTEPVVRLEPGGRHDDLAGGDPGEQRLLLLG